MDLNKNLIALAVASALAVGVQAPAAAKKVDEDDSVYRWGRWSVLAPAAGVEEVAFAPSSSNDLNRCESEANCPGPVALKDPEDEPPQDPPPEEPPIDPPPVDPPIDPPPVDPPIDPPPVDPPIDPPPVDPPKEPPSAAGKPVGFARIDYQEAGSTQTFNRNVGRFSMDNEAGKRPALVAGGIDQRLAFSVAGRSPRNEQFGYIDSGPLLVAVGTDRFVSTERGGRSSISGRYLRDAEGGLALVQGSWRHKEADGAYAHSGEYVWGMTATNEELDDLKDLLANGYNDDFGGPLVAFYSGPTATGGHIGLEMNFTDASWTGSVDGKVVDFTAAGIIEGASFTADPTQFSSNIAVGSLEGALVNAGNNAIGAFEVTEHGELGGLREADIFNAGRIEGGGS